MYYGTTTVAIVRAWHSSAFFKLNTGCQIDHRNYQHYAITMFSVCFLVDFADVLDVAPSIVFVLYLGFVFCAASAFFSSHSFLFFSLSNAIFLSLLLIQCSTNISLVMGMDFPVLILIFTLLWGQLALDALALHSKYLMKKYQKRG